MIDDQGKSRGFGFVAFEDPGTAEVACNTMNGKEIEGKSLFVGRAQKRRGKFASNLRPSNWNVFTGVFPNSVNFKSFF